MVTLTAPQNEQQIEDAVNSMPWYQSSTGPGVSQTIFNIAGNILPVLNLVLASHNINILPSFVNLVITLVVFVYFSIRAMLGYIKSKRTLGIELAKSLNGFGAKQAGGILPMDTTPPQP